GPAAWPASCQRVLRDSPARMLAHPGIQCLPLLVSLMLWAWSASASAAHKNILLLIADDVGADASSLYNSSNTGAKLPPTPNIASLVNNGVVFANAYANPVCS